MKRPDARAFPRRAAALALAMFVAFGLAPCGAGAAETEFNASYSVSVAGVPVGRADARSRFTATGYAAVVRGSTSGISRLVSNARASLVGIGHIGRDRLRPASYTLETAEGNIETHVRMSMKNGRIVDLLATPRLLPAHDRVPLADSHRAGIVDPLAAFLIVTDRPGLPDGHAVCNRRIPVFDGWQRYDIGLAYKETRTVSGGGDAYDGKVVVCQARYIPIAGHRSEREAVKYMAANRRFEIAYAPLGDLALLAPHRILIGTKFGDLVIAATSFSTRPADSPMAN